LASRYWLKMGSLPATAWQPVLAIHTHARDSNPHP